MSNIVFDAPKSPESYGDLGISSLNSDSIQKEASAQVLSEILADFEKDSETGEKVTTGERVASEKGAQEEEVKEEDEKEKEEKKEREEKEKEEGKKSAEDLAFERSLEKDASAYYDLGQWMAIDKIAENLGSDGVVDAKTSAVISLHVAGLTDNLV